MVRAIRHREIQQHAAARSSKHPCAPMTPHRVFIGWDADQMEACAVAQRSASRTTTESLEIRRLALSELVAQGLYTRETRYPSPTNAGYFDVISEAPMSTGHAIA